MADWLDALLAQSTPAILVTVARVEGSAPREAGARMLVSREGQFDTIGGGHLELSAIRFAREMLDGALDRHQARFALGPTLGQCCGGVVWLAFERVSSADHSYYAGTVDPVHARLPRLYLFGAGHVGAAVVRAMSPLPCRITWVDEREELFPASLPANVEAEATDTPEAIIDAAPAGSSYLVMTHSHALDQRLAEYILRRPDVGWFGLIGSRTKRIQFERRLAARGIPPERIAAMICPVGLPGIRGKQPAVIAASVAAQLLAAWEGQQTDIKQEQSCNTIQTTPRQRA